MSVTSPARPFNIYRGAVLAPTSLGSTTHSTTLSRSATRERSMAAKTQLEKLTREGENIGSWAGKKIHKVEFLYEAAEKCRAEGYMQYQNQRLDIAYVMFLRFAKFYELIRSQPSLDPKSSAHNKCKRDLLQSLTLMEELKVRVRGRVRGRVRARVRVS